VLATKHDLLLLRTELREEISGLRTELRDQISGLRVETQKTNADLRAEIHASASGVARQMYFAVLSQSVVMLGFAYFLTTQLR
jgi:hypothetical protein